MRNYFPLYIIIGSILILITILIVMSFMSKDSNQTNQNSNSSSSTSSTSSASSAVSSSIAADLKIEVIEEGSGALTKNGDAVTVDYTGFLVDGTKFDSSVGKTPFTFPLGAGRVIKGWDLGVVNQKVGSKLKLTIPANLGYGATGVGGVIPPNATLIFDVTIIGVKQFN